MPSELTGIWKANDGGTYVMRQVDDTLWWLGLSEDGEFYNGLRFCNVYRGTLIEQVITGEWSDVPRGSTSNHGTLTLIFKDAANPSEQQLEVDDVTGGFSGTIWQRVPPIPPNERDARDLLRYTYKNSREHNTGKELETLSDNLAYIRDSAALWGQVASESGREDEPAVRVGWPPHPWLPFFGLANDIGTSYDDFISNGNGLDGDTTFHFWVDLQKVNIFQPAFLGDVPLMEKLFAIIHLTSIMEGEIIMYGRPDALDPDSQDDDPIPPPGWRGRPLFPGWAEGAGNSVLFNGRPISVPILPAGIGTSDQNFANSVRYGDRIRIIGVLA